MKRFAVDDGDLIMSCSGTFGKVSKISSTSPKGIINQALLKITPHKNLSSGFLKYFLSSKYMMNVFLQNIQGGSN